MLYCINEGLFDFSELTAVPIKGKNMSREAALIFLSGITAAFHECFFMI